MITEEKPVQILELFGGIGSPRCALRNLKIPTKAIDYVEIDEQAVRSYNNMFSEELPYKIQTVVGWNLTVVVNGDKPGDLEQKLEENNESLIRRIFREIKERDDDNDRTVYD